MLETRRSEPNDLPKILDLYQHLVPGDERPSLEAAEATLALMSSYPDSGVFIGTLAGDVVASCTLIVVPNLTRGGLPYALIENVVTHSDHRKCGFGRQVLHHAISAAWDARCYKVMLMTGSKDPATLRFYEQAGFEQTKTGFQMRRPAVRLG